MTTPASAPMARTGASTLWARLLGVQAVSKKRRAVALTVALLADTIQIVLAPMFFEGVASPFDDALDLVVAATLWATLGFSPRLAMAFALELTPGVALFPTWTALVATFPAAKEGGEPETPAKGAATEPSSP